MHAQWLLVQNGAKKIITRRVETGAQVNSSDGTMPRGSAAAHLSAPAQRPAAVNDQRTQSTYLFSAVCPELGTGAALVLPFRNTEAMQLHLGKIATKVTPGAHAIVILDQAGWHGAKRSGLRQYLAPAATAAIPRTQPQENIWQSSCDKTFCRTTSSNRSTTSSITVASPGTPSSISHGKSCLSLAATGRLSVLQFEDWYGCQAALGQRRDDPRDRNLGRGHRCRTRRDARNFGMC